MSIVGLKHTCIHRAEINQRVHGGFFWIVELLGLGTPAENRHGALVAAESHLRVLVEKQELAVSFEAVLTQIRAMTTYHSSLAEKQRVFNILSFRRKVVPE